MLVTLRIDETSPSAVLARELSARGAAVLIEPTRLDATETTRMAAGCLGLDDETDPPAEVLDLLHGSARGCRCSSRICSSRPPVTAGSPRAIKAGGRPVHCDPGRPQTFTDTVARRLAALHRDAVDVVHAAAVLGTTFRWQLLPAVAGCSEVVVLDALRAAIAVGLVVADGDGFAFRHALTATAVLDELLPPERVALSRRAARAMTDHEQELDGPACVLAADLFALAGDPDRAAALLLRAGRQAMAEGAVSGAVALLDRGAALAGPSPTAADIALAPLEAVAATGDADRTATVGRTALDVLADAPAARRVAARLLIARGHVEARPDEARRALDAARAEAGVDRVALARVDGLAALAALRSDRPDRVVTARQLATRAVAVAEAAGLHDVACEALEVIGRCARLSDLDAAETAFARQLQVAKVGRLALWRIRAQNELGTIGWLRRADPGGVQAAHDAAAAAGLPMLAAGYAVDLAVFHTVLGHYDHALTVAQGCHDTARRFGADGLAGAAVLVQAMIAAHRGQTRQTRRHLAAPHRKPQVRPLTR